MMNRTMYVLLISLLAGVLFLIANFVLRGYMRSPGNLAAELKSPKHAAYEYRIADEAPFRYRLLFPAVVKGVYTLFHNQESHTGFYRTYTTISMLFYISAVLAMFYLLRVCGFDWRWSFSGTLVFLLLPPMLMAYTVPVHTREDTLAYTLFFLGLATWLKRKPALFMVISLAGVLCRETLLLLPLLYFFFSGDQNTIRKFTITALPVLLWVSIRLVMNKSPYDPFEGFKWNIRNTEQVIGFLIITFNVCWITFLVHLLQRHNAGYTVASQRQVFYRSAVFTFLVVLVTTYFGGIFNEIRLLYLLSPWMIILLLDFLQHYGQVIRRMVKSLSYRIYAACALVFCALLLTVVLFYQDKLITPGKYNVPYALWIKISIAYILLMLLFLPVPLKILFPRMITPAPREADGNSGV